MAKRTWLEARLHARAHTHTHERKDTLGESPAREAVRPQPVGDAARPRAVSGEEIEVGWRMGDSGREPGVTPSEAHKASSEALSACRGASEGGQVRESLCAPKCVRASREALPARRGSCEGGEWETRLRGGLVEESGVAGAGQRGLVNGN